MAKKKSTSKKIDETLYEDIVDDVMIEETTEPEKTEPEKFVEAEPKEVVQAEDEEQKIPLEQYCAGLNQGGIDKFAFERLSSKITEKLLPGGPHTRTKWETLYLSIRNN